MLHSGNGSDSSQRGVVEARNGVALGVARIEQRGFGDDQVARIEPGVQSVKVAHGPDQQPSRNQQYQAQSDLGGNQSVAHAPSSSARDTAARLHQYGTDIEPA